MDDIRCNCGQTRYKMFLYVCLFHSVNNQVKTFTTKYSILKDPSRNQRRLGSVTEWLKKN